MKPKPGAQANRSIIDAIAVLQALAMSEDPVGSRELARRLDMETTRANRMLKTLAHMGVAQQTSDRKYGPGPGMHVLATQSLYASRLLRCAIGPLEKLAYFGHTVALGVLWQDSVSFLYHRRPGMDSGEAIGRIGLRPATGSGIGMVLLSASSNEDVMATYEGREIPGYPEGVESLIARLDSIRESGFARVLVESDLPEQPDRPTHTVAVPVGKSKNSAIAISGWIPEPNVFEIVEALRNVREEIETAIANKNTSKD